MTHGYRLHCIENMPTENSRVMKYGYEECTVRQELKYEDWTV